jgi:tetratricopeptide (TPR) repeat protein
MHQVSETLQNALRHHQSGELEQAEALYRGIIRVDPVHAEALHLLGVVAHQQQEHLRAVRYIERAISLNDSAAMYHCNLGAAYRDLGRLDDAITSFQTALGCDNSFAGAHYNLAMALEAKGRTEEAADSYAQALHADPKFAVAYNNLGRLLSAQDRVEEAIEHFRQAVRIEPRSAEAHYNLANALCASGRLDEASASFRRALQITPNLPEVHNNLGTALKDLGNFEDAGDCFRQAVALKSDYAEAHNNLGTVFQFTDEPERAISCYERALAIDAEFAGAHTNLANVFADQGNLSAAIAGYERAIAIDGECAEAHFNRALAWIRAGDLAHGWPEYEWRFERKVRRRCFPQPPWKGDSLSGRTILLYAEQGIGDEIMFASCIGGILRQAAGCLIECDPRLVQLFSRSFAPAEVVARAADSQPPNVAANVQCAFGSLPRYLRSSLESFPAGEAFLQADPQLVEQWQRRFDKLPAGLKVGISWRGGKEADVRRKRSTQLEQWERVLGVRGVTFVNLQYGEVAEELQALRQRRPVTIHHWPAADPLQDLEGFAARIAALDLVVSVDNSTVHMAGALGVPVWTLLPFASDWRWFLERTESPWYQSMRLFRQRAAGNWEELFDRVGSALEQAAAAARSGEPTAVGSAKLIEPEC